MLGLKRLLLRNIVCDSIVFPVAITTWVNAFRSIAGASPAPLLHSSMYGQF